MNADDQKWIAECLQGGQAAFGELVRKYQDRLYSSVLRLVDAAEDAQDVVQEAFLHAYQALESFKGDAQFFTWLYRIAMNAAISLKRKKKPVARIVGPDGEPVVEPIDESAGSQPSHALELAEQGSTVWRALHKLSPEHRAVLVMKDMEEMKYEEMADALGVPVGTIRSRLHRARLEFREILESEETQGGGGTFIPR